jgi:hypothetical protein
MPVELQSLWLNFNFIDMVLSGHLAASITHFQQYWKEFFHIWLLGDICIINGSEPTHSFQVYILPNQIFLFYFLILIMNFFLSLKVHYFVLQISCTYIHDMKICMHKLICLSKSKLHEFSTQPVPTMSC